jgi:hypothetical protein
MLKYWFERECVSFLGPRFYQNIAIVLSAVVAALSHSLNVLCIIILFYY